MVLSVTCFITLPVGVFIALPAWVTGSEEMKKIIDEADEMLNMGFYEDIKSILTHTPKEKNSWLFSATMPQEVNTIAKKFMHDPIEITVGTKNSGAKNVNHQYFIVGARERLSSV